MEGAVNTLQLWFTHLSDETLSVLSFMILLVTAALVGFWIYNRRKYQQLAHHIPASVVKNYLDSIIQNSSALKSSLFRGGGLETSEGLSVPSVKSVHELPTGGGGISSESLVQKNAEFASLKSQISDKDQVISELEAKLADISVATTDGGQELTTVEIEKLNTEILDLKDQLAKSLSSSADSENLTRERDDLKNRLAEYEIIEDDLANLKKLQQENKQLKVALHGEEAVASEQSADIADAGSPVIEQAQASEHTAVAEISSETSPEEASQQTNEAVAESSTTESVAEVHDLAEHSAEAEVTEEEIADGEGKSAEDLLSEFEKMLG